MKLLWVVLPVFVLVLLAAAVAGARNQGRKATGLLGGKRPLTNREQAMYFRLVQSFPDHVVLAQVAFSAILTTKDRPTRATFDRKVCDFVLCSKAFDVLAVIELDDASHKGRADADRKRDAILTKAGYRVLRFPQVPDADDLRMTLALPGSQVQPVPTSSAAPTASIAPSMSATAAEPAPSGQRRQTQSARTERARAKTVSEDKVSS
ncbi:hypothetical protein CDN98_03635 [Roseateles terrae]|nr:hypothetical protein CDN98_03635 [Roseateles terrae]